MAQALFVVSQSELFASSTKVDSSRSPEQSNFSGLAALVEVLYG